LIPAMLVRGVAARSEDFAVGADCAVVKPGVGEGPWDGTVKIGVRVERTGKLGGGLFGGEWGGAFWRWPL